MKLIELRIENVKRISAVTITPTDRVTIVGGPHDAGKSTTIDSLDYVLGGKKTLPPMPLHRGTEKGRIVAKLSGDESKGLLPMTVMRTLSAKHGTALEIKMEGHPKAQSPQAILDGFYSHVAFDPMLFTRFNAKQQAEAVRALLGLDFEQIDRQRLALYGQRTIINREAKSLGSQLDAAPKHADAPAEEVSVAELVKELGRRQEVNRANDATREDLITQRGEYAGLKAIVEEKMAEVDRLTKALTEARKALGQGEQHVTDAAFSIQKAQGVIDSLVDEDTAPIQGRLDASEDTNRKVRENAQHAELHTQCMAKEDESLGLTANIDAIDATKAAQIAAAEFPVEGMGFGDDGLTFDGLPFEQVNTERQIRVSVAMGFAANPTFPLVLIREGSLIATDHLPFIVELAEEYDGQVLMERVGEGPECSVIISDGMVKGEDTDEHD